MIATAVGCSSIVPGTVVAEKTPTRDDAPRPLLLAQGQDKPLEKNGKKNGEMPKEEPAADLVKINLARAVELCATNNFRLLAGAEKVQQAEADLLTASLIPNPTLLADYALIPLQRVNPQNQLGPPQADVLLSMPIDWLLFGKRAAAKQAAALGIEATRYDFHDLQRLQIARAVDAFYEVLQTEEMLHHARDNHDELKKIEDATTDLVKAGKADKLELDRIKLAILEAFLEIHDRERQTAAAKAKLRPLIGRSASDPDFEVDGALTVKVVVPPPKLADLIALADANRPDLRSDQYTIDQKRAQIDMERRRAKPQLSLVPGWSYQNQRYISGFRNGSMIDVGVTATLPITDRNQGNIRKAESQFREALHTLQADRADALAEVETTLSEYEDAVEDVTRNNQPATRKAAHDLRERMDAAYRAGTRSLLDYLSAHQAYRIRLDHVVEFEATYWRKLNKLNMVVGAKAFSIDSGEVLKVGEAEK
jgi:cobalt-zinc-cadmium efflux system outer membrane protein